MTSTYSRAARGALARHGPEIRLVLTKYGATNPRLFGSVARGTAGLDSDIDILLDLEESGTGSRLSRLAAIRLELEQVLQMPVDVAYEGLLKDGVSDAVRRQAVAL